MMRATSVPGVLGGTRCASVGLTPRFDGAMVDSRSILEPCRAPNGKDTTRSTSSICATPWVTERPASTMEVLPADRLRKRGYVVFGGH